MCKKSLRYIPKVFTLYCMYILPQFEKQVTSSTISLMVPYEDQLEHAIKIFRIWPPLTALILLFIAICLIFYSLPTEILRFPCTQYILFHSRSCWAQVVP